MVLAVFFLISGLETLALALFEFSRGSTSPGISGLPISTDRLFLLGVLITIGLFFFLLAYLKFASRLKKRKGQILGLVTTKKKFLLVIAVHGFILACLYTLLILPSEKFGDFRLLLVRLKPIISWLIILAGQSLFMFFYYWVSINISGMTNGFRLIQETTTICQVFFGIVIMVSCITLPSTYGPSVGDELEYFNIAFYTYRGIIGEIPDPFHWPPLYPLALLPLMSFQEYSYTLILVLNVIFITSAVFPIYFIARQFTDKKHALVIILVICLLPFHFVFPRRIQSENLYYPLLFWVILFLFSKPKNDSETTIWDIATGILLGLSYLTRYITLAIIPAFLINLSVKKEWRENHQWNFRLSGLTQLVPAFASFFVTYSPWLFLGWIAKASPKELIGFGIASNIGDAAHLTLSNLVIWFFLYFSYFALIASPVLPLIIPALMSIFDPGIQILNKRWIWLVFLFTASFGAAVVRHSWRALYNAEIASKMMGRYLVFFGPLVLLTSIAFLAEESKMKSTKPIEPLISLIASILLSGFAFLVLVQNRLIPTDGSLLKAQGSVDGFLVKLMDWKFPILILLIYFFIFKSRTTFSKYKIILFLVLGLYYLIELPEYSRVLEKEQANLKIGHQISEMMLVDLGRNAFETPINLYIPKIIDSRGRNEIGMAIFVRGFQNFAPYSYNGTNGLKVLDELDGYFLWQTEDLPNHHYQEIGQLSINSRDFSLIKE